MQRWHSNLESCRVSRMALLPCPPPTHRLPRRRSVVALPAACLPTNLRGSTVVSGLSSEDCAAGVLWGGGLTLTVSLVRARLVLFSRVSG